MNKFTADFESLYTFTCPDWFRDAKFGIWSHWGPQSVPMCGDWYARNMYNQGTTQYNYHLRQYGHPSKFGYKDICTLWKAENFDPDNLMSLYRKAGARFFVALAMHHDHFFNYPSRLNRWNSAKVGPKKDICGLWKTAAVKYALPFGLTEHLGASFSWWGVNKNRDAHGPYAGVLYDGADPAYSDFYFDNHEHTPAKLGGEMHLPSPWYTKNERFRDYWLEVMKELIDMYEPALLYSDGSLPFGEHWYETDTSKLDLDMADYKWGLEAVAYLYNASAKKNGVNNAVYLQKDKNPVIHKVGVLDVEKSQLPGISAEPWQTDTCIGNWFYDAKQDYKTASHIIEMLVDIVSKNGTMLLNILQKPCGSIDEETVYILEELSGWFSVCGEGIYGTRPWRVFGEGEGQAVIDGFNETAVSWNSSDFRFTQKDKTVYVFIMKEPIDKAVVIKSFASEKNIRDARLLGHGGVPFTFANGVLSIKLPERLPARQVNCVAVSV